MPEEPSEALFLNIPTDGAKDFLLLEFQTLFTAHENTKEAGEKRLSFYITFAAAISTAIFAGLGLVAREMQLWLLIGGAITILLVGSITFRKMIQRRIAVIIYRRRLSRIRGWFAKYYPEVTSGLSHEIHRNIPMDWGRNNLGTTAHSVALINTAVIVLAVATTTVTITGLTAWWWGLLIASACGALTWQLHLVWKRRLFQGAELRDQKVQSALAVLESRVTMPSTTLPE